MKKLLALSLLCLLPGCGGPDISKFIGGTWTGTASTALNCGGQANSGTTDLSLALSEGTDSDLAGASKDGCTFKFRVDAAGDSATLSNAPVSCSSTQNGMTVQVTINTMTMHTTDGHHLTTHAEGTISAGGQSCSMTMDGTATK